MIAKLLPQAVFLDLARVLLCRAPMRTAKGKHRANLNMSRPLPARAEATKGDMGRGANARWRLGLSENGKMAQERAAMPISRFLSKFSEPVSRVCR
jgi:hypothetical protein